jgi:hypothetical protein
MTFEMDVEFPAHHSGGLGLGDPIASKPVEDPSQGRRDVTPPEDLDVASALDLIIRKVGDKPGPRRDFH